MASKDPERLSEELEILDRADVDTLLEKPVEKPSSPHAAFYVAAWIAFSSGTILYNKWILDTLGFRYPVILTTWHMAFATIMTQIMAHSTTLLDQRHSVKMTPRVYIKAIMPVGFFFSLSLICGNKAYLYLSVAFIQMLKATNPVVVLTFTWTFGIAPFSKPTLLKVLVIVLGVVIASYGEIHFNLTGFLYQAGATCFEAMRLVLIERLLNSAQYKMDPIVSLYYYAPICALMNGIVALAVEVPVISSADIWRVGVGNLIANASVAFMLNVSLVLLIGKTSSLVLTLCGVLKDILLVTASILLFASPVTGTQFFGYSIALAGLIYYKLGGETIRQQVASGLRAWAEFGERRPRTRHAVILASGVGVLLLLLRMTGPPIVLWAGMQPQRKGVM
ncbi:TPT-domain-containing protein [Trichodelitschia bisporula]|uniref:TPT-domain-containing protein n=1 Tax=Trichodelitschia bisporula TaxID=703511 RepID=A0A6G1I4U5_9PEZI|nr:TPT-domain-containing protein [Trichodelitschia bisporula]